MLSSHALPAPAMTRSCAASRGPTHWQAGGGEAAGEEADRGALDIALDAGDLPGEAQPRHRLQPQSAVEKFWTIEEGVAVQAAEARELRMLEAGDHAEDLALLAVLQLGLK